MNTHTWRELLCAYCLTKCVLCVDATGSSYMGCPNCNIRWLPPQPQPSERVDDVADGEEG